ncbi:MAG TPA: O-antigen ligase family protein [Steroidobacteraceae bacterium]|nr:O-antigen ligase family protein [Steroidobacteraceae bacterium]
MTAVLLDPAPIRIAARASVLERMLFGAGLFYAAVVFCLPVPYSEEVALVYPWWAQRIAIGNVQLYELLLLAWMVLYGAPFLARVFLTGGIPTRQAAVWLAMLAVWCGVMSLMAPLAFTDLGRTLRLFLCAALLPAVVRWTRQSGNFPLTMLIFGFFTGSVINLVFSFRNPLIVLETMRLSGQNTPGVAMGIAIHLGAWLFLRSRSRLLHVLIVIATLTFTFGCAISYSRIGWFAGGLGLLSWAYVLFVARPHDRAERRHLRKARRLWVPLLMAGLLALASSPLAVEGLGWMQALLEQKFGSESTSGQGDRDRASYFIGVGEILMRYPAGVGYSGFLDAMRATDIYHSGQANEEFSYEANPHSAFLYYASAGGIPGAVFIVAVFVMLMNSMRVGLHMGLGRTGQALFALIAPAYLLIGLTVPYLVNSIVLIVPAAIAAGWGWSRRVQQATT